MKVWLLCLLCIMFGGSVAAEAGAAGFHVQIVADAELSRAEVRGVEFSVAAVKRFYRMSAGTQAVRAVTFYLVAGEAAYRDALQNQFGIDEKEANRRAKLTGGWTKENIIVSNLTAYGSEENRLYHVAHELTHQQQFALARRSGDVNDLQWLAEGMAEVAAAMIMEQQGVGSQVQFKRKWYLMEKRQQRLPTLVELANANAWYQSLDRYNVDTCYRTAALAALYLKEQYGFESLLEYYRQLGESDGNVAASFRHSFGQDVDAFQQEFDRYLRNEMKDTLGRAGIGYSQRFAVGT